VVGHSKVLTISSIQGRPVLRNIHKGKEYQLIIFNTVKFFRLILTQVVEVTATIQYPQGQASVMVQILELEDHLTRVIA
jgi:hypothetical protein